ncbi:hypothetical protein LUW76_22270 [Actinomadura madurae]|uniref:hypothetical protein n=1 Tax=Actinomadura madurae TaxID=1993 RepID=UPI002026C075|nr:hypothetical protein [Actinomadura madurae]URM96851.1 hypothetical protein LUW76_22270 [Actinomadura madurae]
MIDRLVVFGATDDLNARFLLPGLAALRAAGHLPDGPEDRRAALGPAPHRGGRPAPHPPGALHGRPPALRPRGEALPNVLRFGLDTENMALGLTGIGSGARTPTPLTMTARMEAPDLPAYGRLLLDVLHGNAALSIRGDEGAWRVLAPVMSAWAADRVPLQDYPAGSSGVRRPHR